MAKINGILAIVIWIAACAALATKSDPWHGFLFIVPFCLGPHAVTHFLCFRVKSHGAANLLGIGMLLYAAWFFFIYADVFYFNLDPQSPIALLVVGIASLPVMIPVWIVSVYLDESSKLKSRMRAERAGPGVEEVESGGEMA